MKNLARKAGASVLVFAFSSFFFASSALADANASCTGSNNGSPCGSPPVTGYCVGANDCHATTASGMNVGSLLGLITAIANIMNALNANNAANTGATTPIGGTPGTQGCAQYYAVSQPSSDPCAYYVPPSGSSNINIDTGNSNTNTSSNINTNSGSTDTGNSASNLISALLGSNSGGSSTSTSGISGTANASGTVGSVSSSTAGGARGPGGASGEIRVLPNGATIVITNQNAEKNTVVAGFMGTEASGGAAPTGLVAEWCRTRPWSTNFLSFIIPPVFFDSLCSLRGYQVGLPPQPPGQAQIGSQVTLTQKKIPSQATSSTSTIQYQPYVPASPPLTVDIWAVPAAVPLGARTTIFWTSKNASTCTETSPDGSFSHSSLSGGGATVPLAGATTFTISCIAPDGTHATDYVTVNLAI